MDLKPENFRDWSPIRLYEKSGQIFVDWCFLGRERFIDSFYDDTIEKRFLQPFNLLFRHQTPFDFLTKIYERERGITPTGFIFHISRCGSTLVSQMFASLAKNIVISEASVIDKAVRANSFFQNINDDEQVKMMRLLINALGRKRFAGETNFFIKFDSCKISRLSRAELV